MAARSRGSSLLSNDVLSPTFPSLVIWKLVYDNREGDRGCDQCCRYISFQIFANKEDNVQSLAHFHSSIA